MPVQIVPWQDAITSLYLGKVQSVIDYDEVVRSPSVAMRVPAVIRVLRHATRIKRAVKFSRSNVATRDQHRCQYCLVRFPLSRLTYDHVFPKSRGGETTWENVVCACRRCNAFKGDRTPQEAGMMLHSVPRRPHALPVEPLRVRGPSVPEEWLAFVGASG